jgi:hypothetical protein
MIMQASISFEGKDIEFASAGELAAGAAAAQELFERRQADLLECAASNDKRCKDVELSRQDALNCLIWDEANYAAWHAMTRGWLRRDVDIHLALR